RPDRRVSFARLSDRTRPGKASLRRSESGEPEARRIGDVQQGRRQAGLPSQRRGESGHESRSARAEVRNQGAHDAETSWRSHWRFWARTSIARVMSLRSRRKIVSVYADISSTMLIPREASAPERKAKRPGVFSIVSGLVTSISTS